MRKSDPIQLRCFRRLAWQNPRQVLVDLRFVETNILPIDMDHRIRRLRTNDFKREREARDAALFVYGMATQVLKTPVWFANWESSDFDFVAKWITGDVECFCPVQLKELPPKDMNSEASIDYLLQKVDRYSGVENLTVAILLNRPGRLLLSPWKQKRKRAIGELWYFGCNSPDQSTWFLFGNVLEDPNLYEFEYPTGESRFLKSSLAKSEPSVSG
jgi:hypothetical protein